MSVVVVVIRYESARVSTAPFLCIEELDLTALLFENRFVVDPLNDAQTKFYLNEKSSTFTLAFSLYLLNILISGGEDLVDPILCICNYCAIMFCEGDAPLIY